MAVQKSSQRPLKLQWRPRANLDRQSIAIYLGIECGNPEAALKAIATIDEAIEHIRLQPNLGKRFRHERLRNEYRMVQAHPYTIFCRADDCCVTIYRIMHQRQNISDYELIELIP